MLKPYTNKNRQILMNTTKKGGSLFRAPAMGIELDRKIMAEAKKVLVEAQKRGAPIDNQRSLVRNLFYVTSNRILLKARIKKLHQAGFFINTSLGKKKKEEEVQKTFALVKKEIEEKLQRKETRVKTICELWRECHKIAEKKGIGLKPEKFSEILYVYLEKIAKNSRARAIEKIKQLFSNEAVQKKVGEMLEKRLARK
jgi:hypothetical protein